MDSRQEFWLEVGRDQRDDYDAFGPDNTPDKGELEEMDQDYVSFDPEEWDR